jgi:predicted regulator of Ras-like GTPase activity (Roadblock/LC7/MglB family)
MADIQEFLDKAMAIDGAIGVALVDLDSGMCLGTKGGGALDMELAGASSTQIVQAKKNLIDQLSLDTTPQEALLTMADQYHLVRLFRENDDVFSYLILDAEACSLPLARTQLRSIDQDLSLDSVDPPNGEIALRHGE